MERKKTMAGYYINVNGTPWSIPIVRTVGTTNSYEVLRYMGGMSPQNTPIIPSVGEMDYTFKQDSEGNFVNDPLLLTTIMNVDIYYRMRESDKYTMLYVKQNGEFVNFKNSAPVIYGTLNYNLQVNDLRLDEMGICIVIDAGTARGVYPDGDATFPRLSIAYMWGSFATQGHFKIDGSWEVDKRTILKNNASFPTPFTLKDADNPTAFNTWWKNLGYDASKTGVTLSAYMDSPNFNFGLELCQMGLLPSDEDSFMSWYDSIYTEDPYLPIDDSGAGGGDGFYNRFSENIGIPGLPNISVVDTGFITMYNPTISDLKSLANYMWNNNAFDPTFWKKIFAEPMDAILGLTIVPCAPETTGREIVNIGNIATDVNMPKLASQWQIVNCGDIDCKKFFGSYLDFDPYTKIDIFLPYIGIRPLAMDDVMGKLLHLEYHIDFLSGSCIAFLTADGNCLYTFTGQCAGSIPITGRDMTNVVNGALSITGSALTAVASGGSSLPASLLSSANAVMSMKPQIEKSGNASSLAGIIDHQKPFLIFTYPKPCKPAEQSYFEGYPSFISLKLDDVSGYVEVYKCHLKNIPATSDELEMIESILKEGVLC